MQRLIALFISGVALAACASPTAPTDAPDSRVSLAKKALVGATQLPADKVNTRITFN